MDRVMPLLAPQHITLRIDRQPNGDWEVRAWAGDTQGLVKRSEMDLYEGLVDQEVVDVATAVLYSCLGL